MGYFLKKQGRFYDIHRNVFSCDFMGFHGILLDLPMKKCDLILMDFFLTGFTYGKWRCDVLF